VKEVEEEAEGKHKFNPHDFKWTRSDGKPKNLA